MMADDDFDDLTDEEQAALDWFDSDAGRQACAEWAEEEARRAKGGRRPKGSPPGLSGKERAAKLRRERRMERWADDYTELARRLPREQMDRLEASRIFPDVFLAELNKQWELTVAEWKAATGLTDGPQTWADWLALQALRHDRAQRPPAPPPRNYPTARYEEPWDRRIEKQIRAERTPDSRPDFSIDYHYRQALKRALARVGPVKDLKLRSGKKRPAVTAGAARTIEPTPELRRAYPEQLARLKKRRRQK
jgi:hypothetical protein